MSPWRLPVDADSVDEDDDPEVAAASTSGVVHEIVGPVTTAASDLLVDHGVEVELLAVELAADPRLLEVQVCDAPPDERRVGRLRAMPESGRPNGSSRTLHQSSR